MSGTPGTEQDKVSMGIYFDRADREEAVRIAKATQRTLSQVIRMAISAGLPIIAARELGEDGEAA